MKLEEQNKQILKSDCYKPLCLTCVNGDHGFTASSSSNPVTSVSVKLYTQPSIHPEILQVIAAPLNSLLITYSSLVISAVTIGIKLLWSFTVQQCSGRRLMVRSWKGLGGGGGVWRTRLAGLLTLRSELSRDRKTDKSFMGSTADGDSSWSRQASG